MGRVYPYLWGGIYPPIQLWGMAERHEHPSQCPGRSPGLKLFRSHLLTANSSPVLKSGGTVTQSKKWGHWYPRRPITRKLRLWVQPGFMIEIPAFSNANANRFLSWPVVTLSSYNKLCGAHFTLQCMDFQITRV